MAGVYKHREGWQACANVLGQRVKKNFATEGAAKKWATRLKLRWSAVINLAWVGLPRSHWLGW